METIKTENKPSWFKYLHKLNGWNWRKRLGNFRCKVDCSKISEENRKEIGNYFPYYKVRNAIFLELRESEEYRKLSNIIKEAKRNKRYYNKIELNIRKNLNKESDHTCIMISVYYQMIIHYHKKLIKMYKKSLLDLIRKRFEQENP